MSLDRKQANHVDLESQGVAVTEVRNADVESVRLSGVSPDVPRRRRTLVENLFKYWQVVP